MTNCRTDDAVDDGSRGIDEDVANFARNPAAHANEQFANAVGEPSAVAIEKENDEGDERELHEPVAHVERHVDECARERLENLLDALSEGRRVDGLKKLGVKPFARVRNAANGFEYGLRVLHHLHDLAHKARELLCGGNEEERHRDQKDHDDRANHEKGGGRRPMTAPGAQFVEKRPSCDRNDGCEQYRREERLNDEIAAVGDDRHQKHAHDEVDPVALAQAETESVSCKKHQFAPFFRIVRIGAAAINSVGHR